MLYQKITSEYVPGEPIFFSDLYKGDVSKAALSQQLKKLCDEEKLVKHDRGIYYIPKESRLRAPAKLSDDIIAKYKYVSNGKNVYGYYSGMTLANQVGLCTQVPMKPEIVSNNVAAGRKVVKIGNRQFAVKKPRVTVDEKNVNVLRLLDIINDLDIYTDVDQGEVKELVQKYANVYNIKESDVEKYISKYPAKTSKNYHEWGLKDVFA